MTIYVEHHIPTCGGHDHCFSMSAAFFCILQNDYISMRIITDDLYARLVRHISQNETVTLFKDLIMSKTVKEQEEDDIGVKNEHDE